MQVRAVSTNPDDATDHEYSPWSYTVSAVASATLTHEPADPPTGVTVEPHRVSVEVEWTPSADVGSFPITGFEVQYRRYDEDVWSDPIELTDAAARSHEVTGLDTHLTYFVRVRTVTAGSGETLRSLWSDSARTTTTNNWTCLLYTSPSPRDRQKSRMPSSA